MCIKCKAFVVYDPAQDSAHLVQALAAVVSTCTNESNPAKWSISPLPMPLPVVPPTMPLLSPIMLLLSLAGLSPNPTPCKSSQQEWHN